MRSDIDTLRAEMPVASVFEPSPDAKVAKARALLIRAIAGPSWSERSLVGKTVALLGHALLWLVLGSCIAFLAGFGLLVVGILGFDEGGPSCRGACEEAWFVWVIRASVLMGLVGGGCVVGLCAWQREREIARLGSLSHSALLRAFERSRQRDEAPTGCDE